MRARRFVQGRCETRGDCLLRRVGVVGHTPNKRRLAKIFSSCFYRINSIELMAVLENLRSHGKPWDSSNVVPCFESKTLRHL